MTGPTNAFETVQAALGGFKAGIDGTEAGLATPAEVSAALNGLRSSTTENAATLADLVTASGAGVVGHRSLIAPDGTGSGFGPGWVTGGDSAIEEAVFLTKFATKVTIIHRRHELRASKIMQDRAFANEKIDFRWNSVVEEIVGDGRVEKVVLRDTETGERSDLPVEGLFVAIGHDPNTALFTGQLDLDDEGYIITQADSTRTSVEGVFAAGDVQDHTYRQAITAAGSGCMAAIEAERWLAHVEHAAGV